jgi:hypothetical protein
VRPPPRKTPKRKERTANEKLKQEESVAQRSPSIASRSAFAKSRPPQELEYRQDTVQHDSPRTGNLTRNFFVNEEEREERREGEKREREGKGGASQAPARLATQVRSSRQSIKKPEPTCLGNLVEISSERPALCRGLGRPRQSPSRARTK